MSKETGYNLILDTDGYKISQWMQYPDNTSAIHSYGECRGTKIAEMDGVIFYGLQYIIKKYLTVRIEQWMIDEAQEYLEDAGVGHIYNLKGWQYIVDKHDGYLPIKIFAVKEGTFVPHKNALFSLYSADSSITAWIGQYIESLASRVWSPTTTATKSFFVRRKIEEYYEETSDVPYKNAFANMYETGEILPILLKFNDFGARAGSSLETISVTGSGHLVSSLGSDTLYAAKCAREFYHGKKNILKTIAASEHSTMTILGPDGEFVQFERMIMKFGDDFIFACVSDSYHIERAIKTGWCDLLYEKVMAMNAILVVRPDSGNPITMPVDCVKWLAEKFPVEVNSKGYKVLQKVAVIQGDGIKTHHVGEILELLKNEGFSVDNMAFGMGGGLLQDQTRDTFKFALKNSWSVVDGEARLVYKDPITDKGKKSKKGILGTFKDENDELYTKEQLSSIEELENSEMHLVFDMGKSVNEQTFEEIRIRAESYL